MIFVSGILSGLLHTVQTKQEDCLNLHMVKVNEFFFTLKYYLTCHLTQNVSQICWINFTNPSSKVPIENKL